MINSFGLDEKLILIDKRLSDNEIKNLIRSCDSFVSLHRSEGFGRGLTEAMYLGKPVIGTGYSGNLDFMNCENSILVDYKMIPVEKAQYPYYLDQYWADADIEQAKNYMEKLTTDMSYCSDLGKRAKIKIRKDFSYRATGLNYLSRIRQLYA